MPTTREKEKAASLNSIMAQLRQQCSKAELRQAETFVAQFYANTPPQDLVEREAGNLAAAARSIWKFAAKRKPGVASIRVFAPNKSRDGWHSDYTVAQVVTDDMPFLVDSISAALAERNHGVHLVIHPVLRVRRSAAGQRQEVLPANDTNTASVTESYMSFEIGQCNDAGEMKALEQEFKAIIKDVRAAVSDWQSMRRQIQAIIHELKLRYSEAAAGEVAEAQDFLQWLHDDNFTFLGYREYDFNGTGKNLKVHVSPRTGLGILRNTTRRIFVELRELAERPPEIQRLVRRPEPLSVNKADVKSKVHRPVHLDAIGVKKMDAAGKVIGERLIVGLFTSAAYNSSPRDIPLLRRKVDKTVARAGFPQASHDGKALINILETYPRDELFQVRDDDLMDITMGILHLQERQRVSLFARHDDFNRFVSCLVYTPREGYTTRLRLQLQDILCDEYGGELLSFKTEIADSPLARLHVMITTPPGSRRHHSIDAIERRLADATHSWADHLETALADAKSEEVATTLLAKYGNAFPTGYTERFTAVEAIADIEKIEDVMASGELGMDLYRPAGVAGHEVRFKIFNPEIPLPLSDVLPILEHMGFKVIDERPHSVRPGGGDDFVVLIHDFGLVRRSGADMDLSRVRENFHEVFLRVWTGAMETDGFNGLVFGAQLDWREITILRALAKYLRQAQAPFSQDYMEQTLRNNFAISRKLVELFKAKFDPAQQAGHHRRVIQLRQKILDELDLVESADEDRILRRYLNLIEACLRTNFYQSAADGGPKSYLSLKFDSSQIDELPLPRPLREIFVYSPRLEAIHLRGGMVARGGLRWSDRPEDFRTEILGLMKAQMVKNTVIVPVGSKGGFVVKRPPAEGGRDAFLEEGIACYKMFMSGLLDVTDNLKGNRVVVPDNVIRVDGDDPYLVVAADKGTATFSDIANGVSDDYGFWLGDAYASGGSVGYDHKKMGITARGAWESVKRHFREIGKNIQKEDFTVVGVGDMSGDVFGNGMLLSKCIKLVAAFNHLHIFVDPDPDPVKSWGERRRLFRMARSSWTDYDRNLISKGGGIFERSAKSINVSPEMRKALDISKTTVTPNELLQEILRARAELMWFGGIGTYVKARAESDADAGDRANDAIRIDATEIGASVVGEGANLGVTQLGRIEFGLNGGRINADSIDNSAGVDCSDHEVNIKILLDSVVAKKKLTTPQRNKLLGQMTDEVGELVLRDNYLQSQAITIDQAAGLEILDAQSRFMRSLERLGRLDRQVEFLPDDEILEERKRDKTGLSRAELAVVMSYAKLWLSDELLDSDLPDDPVLQQDLIDYFPTPLRQKYRNEIAKHKLRREIVATVVTNDLVNRVGATFLTDRIEKTGAGLSDIARAFIVTRDVFGLQEIWDQVEALDNRVPAEMQTTLLQDVNQLINRATLFFLRNVPQPIQIGKSIETFAVGVNVLSRKLDQVLPNEVTSRVDFRVDRYVAAGIPRSLANRVAYLLLMVSAGDIIRAAGACNLGVEQVARLYFNVGERFGLGWLRYGAERLPADTHWQKLAAESVIEELYAHQRGITLRIVNSMNGERDAFAAWAKENAASMTQTRQMLNELESAEQVDLSMLAVASRHLSTVAGGGG